MTCRDAVEMIADALEGSTLGESRRSFQDHLGRCGMCRRYLRSYAKTVDLIRGAFAEADVPGAGAAPEELIQAVLRAVEEENDSESSVS